MWTFQIFQLSFFCFLVLWLCPTLFSVYSQLFTQGSLLAMLKTISSTGHWTQTNHMLGKHLTRYTITQPQKFQFPKKVEQAPPPPQPLILFHFKLSLPISDLLLFYPSLKPLKVTLSSCPSKLVIQCSRPGQEPRQSRMSALTRSLLIGFCYYLSFQVSLVWVGAGPEFSLETYWMDQKCFSGCSG